VAFLLFAVLFWVLPIVVGHKIGSEKNRAGWAWGLLLGWIGVIVVACLGPAPETGHRSFQLSHGEKASAGNSMTTPIGPPPNLPSAGWYADPQDGGRVRYWDGSTWTAHTASLDS
jgi:hypothetical protein